MDRRQVVKAALLVPPALMVGCARPAPQVANPPTRRPTPAPTSDRPTRSPTPDPPDNPPPSPPPSPEPDAGPEEKPVRAVEVICRDALGLAAAGAGARQHTISRVTLHHTAVPLESNAQAPARLRGHQRFHQDQGWADIAYHYGIDLAGNVYEPEPSRSRRRRPGPGRPASVGHGRCDVWLR